MSAPPNLEPWVGHRYTEGGIFDFKLLLLGESLYEWKGCNWSIDLQRQLIEQVSRDQWRNRYYTNVFQTVTGQSRRQVSSDAFTAFWDSVVFYNYVPVPVGNRPRVRPRFAAWAAAPVAFTSVLHTHQPQAILALGKELWGRLLGSGIVDRDDPAFGRLNIGSRPHIGFINHPSSGGFSWRQWTARPTQLFARVRAGGSTADALPLPNPMSELVPGDFAP